MVAKRGLLKERLVREKEREREFQSLEPKMCGPKASLGPFNEHPLWQPKQLFTQKFRAL